MKTNAEFQEELARYPGDLPVALAIKFNDNISLFYELAVSGIQSEDMKIVIINNEDVDLEYETLLNGAEVDEEIYS